MSSGSDRPDTIAQGDRSRSGPIGHSGGDGAPERAATPP